MTGSLAIRPCTRGLHDLGKGARAWLLPVVALCLLLAGCIAPALLLPSSGQLMWALLKPLVGFDPNQSSGMLTSVAWADCLVVVPPGTTVARGDPVRAMLI